MSKDIPISWKGGQVSIAQIIEGIEGGIIRRKEIVKGMGEVGGKMSQNMTGVLDFESFRCPFLEGEEGKGGGGRLGRRGEKKSTKGEMLEGAHLALVKRFGLLQKKLNDGMEGLGREGKGMLVAIEKWKEAKRGYREMMKDRGRGSSGGGGGSGSGGLDKERERERLRQKLGQVGVEGWKGMGRLRGCLDRAMGCLWGVCRGLKKVKGREKLCHVSHVCVYLYFSVVEAGGRRILELLFGEGGGKGGKRKGGGKGEVVVEAVEECLSLCREVVRGATELFQCLYVVFRYISGVFDPSSLSYSPTSSLSSRIPPIIIPPKVPSLPNPVQTPGFIPSDSPLLPSPPRLFPLILSPEMKFPPQQTLSIPPLCLQRTPQQTFLSILCDISYSSPSPSPSPSLSFSSSLYSPSNEKAIIALQTVENKMKGIEKKKKQEGKEILTVTEQFDFLVSESMSENNLSKLYEGWLAWI